MIITDRFVFLHLHRSGGTFVNDFLLRFVPEARRIGHHLPRKLVPPPAAGLPALGLVRNPWAFYVLWHSYQSRLHVPNAVFRVVSEGGRLDFEHTIANLLELGTTGRFLEEIVRSLPDRYTNRGLNLPGFALEPIRASGRGLYSHLYYYLYDGPGVLHIRRVDRIREEFASLLAAVGEPITAAMRAHIRQSPAGEAPEAVEYTHLYGDTLRDIVAERDADIIARYGYRFGD